MKRQTIVMTILLMFIVAGSAWADGDVKKTRVIEIKDGNVVIMDDGEGVPLPIRHGVEDHRGDLCYGFGP